MLSFLRGAGPLCLVLQFRFPAPGAEATSGWLMCRALKVGARGLGRGLGGEEGGAAESSSWDAARAVFILSFSFSATKPPLNISYQVVLRGEGG